MDEQHVVKDCAELLHFAASTDFADVRRLDGEARSAKGRAWLGFLDRAFAFVLLGEIVCMWPRLVNAALTTSVMKLRRQW